MIKPGKYESKPSKDARVHFTGNFKNWWGKILPRVADIFDSAAAKHGLEKVCRSPQGERNSLPTPFVLLNISMRSTISVKNPLARDQHFLQAVWWELCSQPLCRGGHEFQLKELSSGLVQTYSLHKPPLLFLQKPHLLRTSWGPEVSVLC